MQVVRTSFLGPRPRFYPPPDTKRLMVSHWFYYRPTRTYAQVISGSNHRGKISITFVNGGFYICDQSLLHSRALINFWSVVLTFEDLITFVTNFYVCGFSRVSLRQFLSIEIFKRWKEIPLYCPLKNRYTRYTRYSRYTRCTRYSQYTR